MAEGTITERGRKLLTLQPPPPEPLPLFQAGGMTFHTHTCAPAKGDPHKWLCNSPYCAVLDETCPDHGGLEPIIIGREPWRR